LGHKQTNKQNSWQILSGNTRRDGFSWLYMNTKDAEDRHNSKAFDFYNRKQGYKRCIKVMQMTFKKKQESKFM
jgi:hypothetical protein